MKKLLLKLFAASLALAAPTQMVAQQNAYGFLFQSKYDYHYFVKFDSQKPQTLTAQGNKDYSYYQPSAGEWFDGKFYAYTIEFDDYSAIYANGWAVYEGDNYKKISSKYTKNNRVVDMTYDYVNNTMYALVEDKKTSGEIGPTSLYAVDLATGDLQFIGTPGQLLAQDGYGKQDIDGLVTLACDANGQLYAMSYYRYLYKVDKFSGRVEQAAPRHNLGTAAQFQSMAFDAQGTLWWSQAHPSYQHFCAIDLTTGVPGGFVDFNTDYPKLNRIGTDHGEYGAQVVGIHFKDKQMNTAAPLAVKNLTASANGAGGTTINLAWELPTADYAGNAPALTGVYVYRLGTSLPIATLAADATSFVDANAPNGDVTYEVVPFNATGNGLPAFASAFSGCDQLKAVGNLTLTAVDKDITLSWDAPTETVNGGYADYDNISYTIVRSIAGSETVVASDYKETSFTENITEFGQLTYTVVPQSGGVAGLSATSNAVIFAGEKSIPYRTGFEDSEDGLEWTAVNNGAKGWTIAKGSSASYVYEGKAATSATGGSSDLGDDWLISPAINFQAGPHTIEFVVNGGSYSGDLTTLYIYLGTDKDDLSTFTNKIFAIEGEWTYDKAGHNGHAGWKLYQGKFDVPRAGKFHIGLHNKTQSTYATVRYDNLFVDTDKSAVSGIGTDSSDAPVEYYNLQGVRVPAEALAPGLYLRRQGSRTTKVLVR